MATWRDIERAWNELEQLDKATLEAFVRVIPPPSNNPVFNRRADHAMQRIHRRLDQISANERVASQRNSNAQSGDERWYKKPIGIIILSIAAGLVLLLIKFLIGI